MTLDEALEMLLDEARTHEALAAKYSHNMGGTMHGWQADAIRDAYRAIQDARSRN